MNINIEQATGLEKVSVSGCGGVFTVFTNGQSAPDNVQRWYRACIAAGKELPYDAVDLVPAVVSGLANLGITVSGADDIRGKMPKAVAAFNAALAAASTPDEKIAVLTDAVNLLAAYVGVIGRSY